MKKISILTCAVALGVCASSAHAVDVLGAECEQVAAGERGDILVKCPVTDALTEIRNGTPDAMFMSVNMDVFDFEQLKADDAVYVNVVSDDCGPAGTGYRVVIENPEFDKAYAVTHCVSAQ